MIKLADAGSQVYVSMMPIEFKALARVSNTNDIPDGDNVSLAWLKNLIDSSEGFQTELTTVKDKLKDAGIIIDGMII